MQLTLLHLSVIFVVLLFLSEYRGHSSGESAVFRKCYDQLGELCSTLKLSTPIVALTATDTKTVRRRKPSLVQLRFN